MNKNLLIIALLAIIATGGWYFYQQQHTHTTSINLPGGKDISITTHD